jgi:hypothetical protein
MAAPTKSGFGEIRIEALSLFASEVRGIIVDASRGAIHVRVSQFVSSDSVRM